MQRGLHAADSNKMGAEGGGDGLDHVCECEGQWGLFSTNLPVFLAALERLIERGYGEREGG